MQMPEMTSCPWAFEPFSETALLRTLNNLKSEVRQKALSDPRVSGVNDTYILSLMRNESNSCMCPMIDDYIRGTYNIGLHCEEFPFVHPLWIQIFYILLFAITILLALVGNFTVMWIVLRHRSMRTITNYFLLNLAIADASISIFNTGFSWTYNFYYQWIFGLYYCRVNNLMGITPICASVFTMIAMSIDRYWAIVHPLRPRMSRRATGATIWAVWFLAILCGLPSYFFSKIERQYFYNGETLYEHIVCMSDNYPVEYPWGKLYTSGLVIVQYFIPLLILACAYFRVGTVLRKSKCVGDSQHAKSIAAKRRASVMLGLVVFIFMVVWFPYNTYFVLADFLPKPEDHTTQLYIYINIYWLGMSSTVFNPVIYYFMNKRFRVGFRYAFRWLPRVRSSRGDYLAILSSNARPSLLPSHTAATEF